MRIDLGDAQGNRAYAKYSTFSIGVSSTRYRLSVSGYSGTAGDSMAYTNGASFSTKDRDYDGYRYHHCATRHHGAWWYRDSTCTYSNLNGLYDGNSYQGIRWYHWKYSWESFKFSEMKICCSST